MSPAIRIFTSLSFVAVALGVPTDLTITPNQRIQLNTDYFVKSFLRRFITASVLWGISWPIFWFFKIGDITGPKAWFWIIGELNYPVVAVAYVLIDGMLVRSGVRPLAVFLISVATIAVCLPFYYQRFGFVLGVSLEARLF